MSWQCCVSLCVCVDERYAFACSGICVLRMSTLWLCFYTHTEHAHIIPIMKCIKQWVHAPVRTSWLHSSSLALTSPPPFMLLLLPATCQHLPTIIWSSPLRSTTCSFSLPSYLLHQSVSPNICDPLSSSGPLSSHPSPRPLLTLFYLTCHLPFPLGGWMMGKREELGDDSGKKTKWEVTEEGAVGMGENH